ncbi:MULTISPECIES: hypothetical protein [Emticicia]|uniref:hypothetical protein n=1 Tax=Emticicia TaxID=312278 RepID=UPI0007D8B28A|nr:MULTISPECIES: hypothetical protein [Emticicia]
MNLIQQIQNLSIYDWLLGMSLVALLFIQYFKLIKEKGSKRYGIKVGLNIALWLIISLFIINPTYHKQSDTNKILVVSENIPLEIIQKTKDSLKIQEYFTQQKFNKRLLENDGFETQIGQIYFLGQDVRPEILSKLVNHTIHWLPFFKDNEIQEVQWRAIVNKGDIQEINGKIHSSENQKLTLKWGNQTIDSVNLKKGFNYFSLRTPVFSIGRNTFDLVLNEKKIQEIKFFSQKNQPIKVLMILSNPDFEGKILADWLGKNGNQVKIISNVAKNTQSTISINQSESDFVADIIITDPNNVENTTVKKAFNEGKSILFINIEQADLAAKSINQTFGTNWALKRISTQENIPILTDLTAKPFAFQSTDFQKLNAEFPIAIQKRNGRIGLSLLNETFPLILSGDSLTYMKIWQGTIHYLLPPKSTTILLDGPIFSNSKLEMNFNNDQKSSSVIIEEDTIQKQKSPINSTSNKVYYSFKNKNWQKFQDSLEVFVEDKHSELTKANAIKPYLNTSNSSINTEQKLSVSVPEWIWFILILSILTALWIEPKI